MSMMMSIQYLQKIIRYPEIEVVSTYVSPQMQRFQHIMPRKKRPVSFAKNIYTTSVGITLFQFEMTYT